MVQLGLWLRALSQAAIKGSVRAAVTSRLTWEIICSQAHSGCQQFFMDCWIECLGSLVAADQSPLPVPCHMSLSIRQVTAWQADFHQNEQGREQERIARWKPDSFCNLFMRCDIPSVLLYFLFQNQVTRSTLKKRELHKTGIPEMRTIGSHLRSCLSYNYTTNLLFSIFITVCQ